MRKLVNAALTEPSEPVRRELRVVQRARRADVGVGGDEVLLGLQDVGPALEQRRGQVGREYPAATSSSMLLPRGIGYGLRPCSTAIRFSCAAMRCSSEGMAASACWYCDWTCSSSSFETTPPLCRSSKMRSVFA